MTQTMNALAKYAGLAKHVCETGKAPETKGQTLLYFLTGLGVRSTCPKTWAAELTKAAEEGAKSTSTPKDSIPPGELSNFVWYLGLMRDEAHLRWREVSHDLAEKNLELERLRLQLFASAQAQSVTTAAAAATAAVPSLPTA